MVWGVGRSVPTMSGCMYCFHCGTLSVKYDIPLRHQASVVSSHPPTGCSHHASPPLQEEQRQGDAVVAVVVVVVVAP